MGVEGMDGAEGGVGENFGGAVAGSEEEGCWWGRVCECCLVGLEGLGGRKAGGGGWVEGYGD